MPQRCSVKQKPIQLVCLQYWSTCGPANLAIQKQLVLQEKLYRCPAILYLRKSLEEEREAVCDFLHAILDEILEPIQEAYLDALSYPWCPDVWEISNAVARYHKVMLSAKIPQSNSLACVFWTLSFWFITLRVATIRGSLLRLTCLRKKVVIRNRSNEALTGWV